MQCWDGGILHGRLVLFRHSCDLSLVSVLVLSLHFWIGYHCQSIVAIVASDIFLAIGAGRSWLSMPLISSCGQRCCLFFCLAAAIVAG
jgi:hypothetical protein